MTRDELQSARDGLVSIRLGFQCLRCTERLVCDTCHARRVAVDQAVSAIDAMMARVAEVYEQCAQIAERVDCYPNMAWQEIAKAIRAAAREVGK